MVDITICNDSTIEASTFRVNLLLDGEFIHSFNSDGNVLPGGTCWTWPDWVPQGLLARITEGTHVLTMVIDPTNTLEESSEDDNVYSKTIVWRGLHDDTVQNFTDSA